MYISRLQLRHDISPESIWHFNTSTYGLHKHLWRMMPGDQRSFLYRYNTDREEALVISKSEPAPNQNVWLLETKPFKPRLAAGQLLNFQLRFSPARRKERKRYDPIAAYRREHDCNWAEAVDAALNKWFHDRVDRLGFQVVQMVVDNYRQEKFTRRGNNIQFPVVDVRGVLKVTDQDAFQNTLKTGIGASKAFGCGMLLVAPVQYVDVDD
jgi:CRISPR system Cascade subunit CasE